MNNKKNLIIMIFSRPVEDYNFLIVWVQWFVAACGVLGIAATLGGFWLQNRISEKQSATLNARNT